MINKFWTVTVYIHKHQQMTMIFFPRFCPLWISSHTISTWLKRMSQPSKMSGWAKLAKASSDGTRWTRIEYAQPFKKYKAPFPSVFPAVLCSHNGGWWCCSQPRTSQPFPEGNADQQSVHRFSRWAAEVPARHASRRGRLKVNLFLLWFIYEHSPSLTFPNLNQFQPKSFSNWSKSIKIQFFLICFDALWIKNLIRKLAAATSRSCSSTSAPRPAATMPEMPRPQPRSKTRRPGKTMRMGYPYFSWDVHRLSMTFNVPTY